MPKRLPRMHIRNVNLDKRNVHARQGISDGDARVRVRARVDDDGVRLAARRVDAVDYRALRVGLEGIDRGGEFLCLGFCLGFHVLEGC